MSLQHHAHFTETPLSDTEQQEFEKLARESLDEQRQIEAGDRVPFAEFLDEYFRQE
jgi:gamma-glutamylcysteine synthetase